MRTRRVSATLGGLLALAALVPGLQGCALEQILIGQWYTLITPAEDACPRLVWRFVVDARRSINGSVSRLDQPVTATLTGVLNADDSFQMTAAEVGGTRTARVTGQFSAQVSTIAIEGGAIGSACDGKVFRQRLGRYFSLQGGGGGGGGR